MGLIKYLTLMAVLFSVSIAHSDDALHRQGATNVESTSVLDSCELPRSTYYGNDVKTVARSKEIYMMFSAHNLSPYSDTYSDNVLSELGRKGIPGIVYTTMGELSEIYKKKNFNMDEIKYNKKLLCMAESYGARMWLQIRVYANRIAIPGKNEPINYTAEQIISGEKQVQDAFVKQLSEEFEVYNDIYNSACNVIVFEEAGIYHHPLGGGYFWSSNMSKINKRSDYYDNLFAERMVKIFSIINSVIKKQNPACRVGIHIGHSALINEQALETWMRYLETNKAKPDFMFYDFYLKAQKDADLYKQKIIQRKRFLSERLGLPVYHLAQLHTMNAFQHGGNRTPSRAEIDDIVDIDLKNGFHGIGFYGKNALPTEIFENNPLDPNSVGQQTIYESSKDRWDYGVLKLYELKGIDFRYLFDLVLRGSFKKNSYTLSLKNSLTGAWDFIAHIDPEFMSKQQQDNIIVFRGLSAEKYLSGMEAVELKLSSSTKGSGDIIEGIYISPSEPSKTYRTVQDINQDIEKQGYPDKQAAFYKKKILLDQKDIIFKLCISNIITQK